MITGTYNLVADPSWDLIQLQEVRLECDTTLGPVTINLPEISSLSQSTNLKLIVVDATANASTNNIIVNSDGSDTFDDSVTNQIVLDTDGSSVIFQNVAQTQWIATDSVNGASSKYNDILYADLYNKIINKQLIPGGKYRLLNYKSVNFLNGVEIANINPTPVDPSFNPREVYVGPNEILLLEAISDYQLSPIAISEQYPQDIIQFQGFTNKIALGQTIYNGGTLPDSTIVTGFDLQWDGTNVYFNMPTNYPVLFGYNFYLYADFNGGSDFIENGYGVLTPFLPEPDYQYQGGAIQTNIEISSNGIKIILPGITFSDFQNYDVNSLYVESFYAIDNAYGCISRRNDTYLNINVPFDFRARKYRRYEVDLSSNTAFGLVYAGIGDNPSIAGSNRPTTGNFEDYNVFYSGSYNVIWEGPGGYSFSNDNNVFMNAAANSTIGNFCVNNTFMLNFESNSIREYFQNNIIQEFYNNDLSNNFGDNIAVIFNNNFTVSSFYGCILTDFFENKMLGFCAYNTIAGNCRTNIFGDGFFNNIIGANFAYNKIGNSFSGNSSISDGFLTNIIGDGFAQNLAIGNGFQKNIIGNNFGINSIQENFQGNNISNDFIQNTIGLAFQNNNITNNFQQNIIDSSFQLNTITTPVTTLNFTGATRVYAPYNCTILKGSDFNFYLTYFNGTNQLFVSPTA